MQDKSRSVSRTVILVALACAFAIVTFAVASNHNSNHLSTVGGEKDAAETAALKLQPSSKPSFAGAAAARAGGTEHEEESDQSKEERQRLLKQRHHTDDQPRKVLAAAKSGHLHEASLSFRFFQAFLDSQAIISTDSYSMQVCGRAVQLGARGSKQTIPTCGSLCEAFIARQSIMIIDKVLRRDMNVLEFSTGSSTLWYLMRVAKLVSVEHCGGWLDAVRGKIEQLRGHVRSRDLLVSPVYEKQLQQQQQRVKEDDDLFPAGSSAFSSSPLMANWIGHHGPCRRNSCSCEFNKGFQDSGFHAAYVNMSFLRQHAPFDVVSIDGRGRAHCLKEVIASLSTPTPLLKDMGILVLDNTQRKRYWQAMLQVPSHWPVLHFTYPEGERTTIWVRCEDDRDPYCTRVAKKLREFQSGDKRHATIEIDVEKTW